MNKDQYARLTAFNPSIISADECVPANSRTLLYGYTCDRDTWHLYMEDGFFNLVVYNSGNVLGHDTKAELEIDVDGIVPDKRLYPGACDYDFCVLLKERGVYLPFTTFQKKHGPAEKDGTPFVGLTIDDFDRKHSK